MDNVSLGKQDDTEEQDPLDPAQHDSLGSEHRLPRLDIEQAEERTAPLLSKSSSRGKCHVAPHSETLPASRSSRTSLFTRESQDILHLSSNCMYSNGSDSAPHAHCDPEADQPPMITRTESNLVIIPEIDIIKTEATCSDYSDSVSELLNKVHMQKGHSANDDGPCIPERQERRNSFAGYHVCRKRSASVPMTHDTLKDLRKFSRRHTSFQVPPISSKCETERNLHRTVSGLGIMGEMVVEEEEKKSKVIAMFEPDISNKKMRRYYNGIVGVLEDKQRQERIMNEEHRFIIHPLSTFRLAWDTLLLFAIFLTMILLPFKISFYRIFDDGMSVDKEFWYTAILFIDLTFLVDVVLNFFTGTVDTMKNPPRINLSLNKVQLRYVKTWFVPDLLSSIPFDIIGSEISSSARARAITFGASKLMLIAKVLKIFSLVRILRLGRLHYITKRWIQIFEISPLLMRIIQLFLYFFLIAHWSGCFQFFVVYCRDFPEESWPVKLNIQNSSVGEQYIWSFFRSLSHMLTIGYGKDPPSDTIEVVLIIPSMLIGAFFYMMIVSQMTKTISMFRVGDIRYTQKLKEVDEFTKKFQLGCDIHQRMHEFYHHKYGGEIHEVDEIIEELPLSLRIDVIKARMQDLLENVFFLKTGCEGFIEQCILSTKSAVFMTGDIIVRSEDTIEDLYIIAKGTVSIEFTTDGNTLNDEIIVRQYGFFGETPMLLHKNADMMVYAETPCDVYLVPQFIFISLIERYSQFKNQMLLVAHSRIQLQGLDPFKHAPHIAASFRAAIRDKDAVHSTEDILELASQSALNPAMMEEFRNRNVAHYSVFRRQVAHKPGEVAPSNLTPIVEPQYNNGDIHVSVSIHDDRTNAKAKIEHQWSGPQGQTDEDTITNN